MKLGSDIVVVVTGGASGLGLACVQYFASKGCKTAAWDRQASIKELPSGTLFVAVDVTSEAAVKEAVEKTVKEFGQIHILINCAGIAWAMRTLHAKGPHDFEPFRRVMDINVNGTFNTSRLCAAQMAKQKPVTTDGTRGVIIHTASVAAYEGQIGQTAYSASKGAVTSMTLAMARDLSREGIRCCNIAPGIIASPMTDQFSDKVRDSLVSQTAFPKRFGYADEFARLCGAICEIEYLNGVSIRMDGGIRMAAL